MYCISRLERPRQLQDKKSNRISLVPTSIAWMVSIFFSLHQIYLFKDRKSTLDLYAYCSFDNKHQF